MLKDILPEGNELPSRTYEAKRMLCPMGMSYKKIHACPNDCILDRKEHASRHECPKCGLPWYKMKNIDGESLEGPPAKVLWYLPIVPRLKCLFASANDAKNLTWHAEGRVSDDKLRHPADSPQ